MEEIASAFTLFISLAGLWFIIFWLYRDYQLDRFRQKMFGLRDQLFDEAYRGLVPFEHPAYGLIRGAMNGYIRFGHKIGWIQFLASMIIANSHDYKKVNPIAFSDRWERASNGLDPDTKEHLILYINRMRLIVIEHIVFGSPVLSLTVLLPALTLVVIKERAAPLLRVLRKPISEVDSAAVVFGNA